MIQNMQLSSMRRTASVAAVSALLAFACGGPHDHRRGTCQTDIDCPNGESCEMDAGMCAVPVDAGPADDGGSDGGGDAGPDAGACVPPANGYVAPDGGVQPTFSDIYKKILNYTPGCVLCHNGTPAYYVSLADPATAYAQLVGQPVGSPDWKGTGYTTRVVPGDPAHSALSAVVSHPGNLPPMLDMPSMGMGMPLTQQQIDAINGWIANCAPNN